MLCCAGPGFGPPPQGGFGGGPGGFGAPPPGGGYGGYPPPPPIRQMHAMAIVSLVAAIVSWFMCPLIGGIVALVCGQMARNAIRAEPNKWDGNGLAVAGMIVGAVNLGIYLLVGILYLLMFVGVFGAALLGA